jgi:HK97 family phage portal protein
VKLFGINFGERKSDTGSSRDEILQLLAGLGGSVKSGATVNWKTAIEVGTVFACARVIAEGLSQVPFKLFQETTGGGREAARAHPLYKLLARRPNPWQTSFEFRETLALHLVLASNAYVFKNMLAGKVIELLPFQPGQVTVKRSGWELSYEITTADGTKVPVPASQMWHLRGPSWDGVVGLDAVRLARESIGLALATEEHSARMFSNGAAIGGVLTTDATLKTEQVDLLRKSWETTQTGVRNAFKTAILWGGLKWLPRGQQNDQAQLIEQRRFQVEEICRHFRVMPIMVGYSDKAATYASAEQMFLAHVVHTLGPWYSRLEQSAESALLTEKELDAGYYFKFIAGGLMRGAHADRAAYYSKALGAGGSPAWMTQDEIRGLEEMNPMGGTAAQLPVATNVGGKPAITDTPAGA